MTDAARPWLLAAGGMSIAASLLHLACIVGGPEWYRVLGAGEAMVRAVARGAVAPHVITGGIALVLAIWGFYAFSAAGLAPRLPLMRTALVVISAVLLVRGLGAPLMMAARPDLSGTFLLWSGVIVAVYGLAFAVGTWLAWPSLGRT